MKYSIITINYNNKDGLKKTIESVIHQSYKDFEYIVIDGGSTDGSIDVIRQYANKINYWVSEPDRGIYHAMNKGIEQAHGEYLNFMNSGDYFHNSNVLTDICPHLSADIVEGNLYNIFSNKHSLQYRDKIPTMHLFYSASLSHQACFIKKCLFQNNKFDENYKIISDWVFFIETIVFQNKSYLYVPINVVEFEGNGISATAENLNKNERDEYLNKRLPPKILADYERFKDKDSPILDLIPQFNKTYRLHQFIYKIVKCILYIHSHISIKKKKTTL